MKCAICKMKCEICKELFESRYKYCPYDGNELIEVMERDL